MVCRVFSYLARWKGEFFLQSFVGIPSKSRCHLSSEALENNFARLLGNQITSLFHLNRPQESLSTIFWSNSSFTEVPFETADSSLWESQHSSHCSKEMHLFVWKSGWPSFETGSSWSDTKRQQYGTSCSHYSGPSTSPSTGYSTY